MSSTKVAYLGLMYWSVRSSSKKGGKGEGNEGDIFILASCEHHFIRVHEKLVQHPSNNISIPFTVHYRDFLYIILCFPGLK